MWSSECRCLGWRIWSSRTRARNSLAPGRAALATLLEDVGEPNQHARFVFRVAQRPESRRARDRIEPGKQTARLDWHETGLAPSAPARGVGGNLVPRRSPRSGGARPRSAHAGRNSRTTMRARVQAGVGAAAGLEESAGFAEGVAGGLLEFVEALRPRGGPCSRGPGCGAGRGTGPKGAVRARARRRVAGRRPWCGRAPRPPAGPGLRRTSGVRVAGEVGVGPAWGGARCRK